MPELPKPYARNSRTISKAQERRSSYSSLSTAKRGNKTKSEWEELEALTKDELIIELVRARTCYRGLRGEVRKKNVWPLPEDLAPAVPGRTYDEDGGQPAPAEWAEKIALYGAMHPKDAAFYPCDLMNYGLTSDQANRICTELRRKGLLKVPDGTDYYDVESGEIE